MRMHLIFMVGQAVVSAAEELEVVGLSLASPGPVLNVVGVAPAGGHLAAGVGAVLVPLVEESAEGRRDDPGAAAGGHRSAIGIGEDRGEGGVAGEAPEGFQADRPAFQVGETLSGEPGEGNGDQQVGFLPAEAGPVRAVEVAAADLDQGVGPALGRAAPIFSVQLSAWIDRSRRITLFSSGKTAYSNKARQVSAQQGPFFQAVSPP